MKIIRLSVLLLLAAFIITGCGKKKEKQIIDLQAKNVQLQAEYEQKDSMLNELFTSINDIERNLSDITAREKLITEAPTDEKRMNMDVRDKIMDEIILINNIMEENKKRIAALQEQLKKSNTRIASLEETIKMLTVRLEEKEMEIASLKEKLMNLNFTVESLNATVDTLRQETASQSKVISQQDAMIGEMNTIWYVIGTKKELEEKGIIEKAGGLFSGEMVMTEMINPDHFTTNDMRKLTRIPFDGAKATLVTVHAEGTYRLLQENEMYTGIEILDPTEFWKSSRFLVIMIK
jgi:septal ring factor EnvC (AmiA/AmiB activator)